MYPGNYHQTNEAPLSGATTHKQGCRWKVWRRATSKHYAKRRAFEHCISANSRGKYKPPVPREAAWGMLAASRINARKCRQIVTWLAGVADFDTIALLHAWSTQLRGISKSSPSVRSIVRVHRISHALELPIRCAASSRSPQETGMRLFPLPLLNLPKRIFLL